MVLAALILGLVFRLHLSPWFWRGLGVLVVAWVFAWTIAHQTMARPVRITGTTLTLRGVAPGYVDALDAARSARLAAPAEKGAGQVREAARYKVVGFLPDGQKQVVATFAAREEAQQCAYFLDGGGKFQRVEVEGSES